LWIYPPLSRCALKIMRDSISFLSNLMSSRRLPIHIDVILLPVLSGFRFQGLLLESSSTWCPRVDSTLWSFGLVVHQDNNGTRSCTEPASISVPVLPVVWKLSELWRSNAIKLDRGVVSDVMTLPFHQGSCLDKHCVRCVCVFSACGMAAILAKAA
jgi:hypothetical protein